MDNAISVPSWSDSRAGRISDKIVGQLSHVASIPYPRYPSHFFQPNDVLWIDLENVLNVQAKVPRRAWPYEIEMYVSYTS